MDYLGWELERQRAALAALLLGGGAARESVPDKARRSGTGTPEFYAGSSQQAPGAWETVRAVRQDREDSQPGMVRAPVSAWEAALSKESAIPVRFGERIQARLSGGTGAQPEFPRSSGGYTALRGVRRTEMGLAAETQGSESGGSGAGDNAASSEARISQDKTATTAGERSERFRNIRRSSQRAADTPDLDGLTVSQETGRTSGTAPWGGGWTAAALWAEDSAKTLSRAIQRDARRYDGGFNIY